MRRDERAAIASYEAQLAALIGAEKAAGCEPAWAPQRSTTDLPDIDHYQEQPHV